ncbi:MAG: hypothetical protein RLZZ597_3674 [Cyanobacteriota bacterium]|jgi:hypothetical protein
MYSLWRLNFNPLLPGKVAFPVPFVRLVNVPLGLRAKPYSRWSVPWFILYRLPYLAGLPSL